MYHWHRSIHRTYRRPVFPKVTVERFAQAASESSILCAQLEQLCRKIARDSTFAEAIKNAAQQSNQKEVERLIKTVVTSSATIRYTPDGLVVETETKKEGYQPPLGKVSISLRW